jgi:hypothetical protein
MSSAYPPKQVEHCPLDAVVVGTPYSAHLFCSHCIDFFRLLAVLQVCAVCLHPALCLVKEGDVIILSDDDFDRETASGVWMIDIYAPWCVHPS